MIKMKKEKRKRLLINVTYYSLLVILGVFIGYVISVWGKVLTIPFIIQIAIIIVFWVCIFGLVILYHIKNFKDCKEVKK